MDHRSHQLWEFPHNLAECYSDLQRPHPKWSVWTSSMWILLISAYLNLQNCVGHEPITMAIHKHPDKLACKGLAWATILTTHSETRKGSWSDTWISSDQQWHRIPREEWASQDSWIFERSCWFSIQLPCLRKMILLTYDQTGGVPVGERLRTTPCSMVAGYGRVDKQGIIGELLMDIRYWHHNVSSCFLPTALHELFLNTKSSRRAFAHHTFGSHGHRGWFLRCQKLEVKPSWCGHPGMSYCDIVWVISPYSTTLGVFRHM